MNKIPSMFSKKYKKIWEFYWNKGQLELYSDTYNKKIFMIWSNKKADGTDTSKEIKWPNHQGK